MKKVTVKTSSLYPPVEYDFGNGWKSENTLQVAPGNHRVHVRDQKGHTVTRAFRVQPGQKDYDRRNSALPETDMNGDVDKDMVVLGHLLGEWTEADFALDGNQHFSYDKAYENNIDDTFKLYTSGGDHFLEGDYGSGYRSIKTPASGYVRSNIEDGDNVRMTPQWTRPGQGLTLAKWNYAGNPYYENDALKRRIAVCCVIDLMMAYHSGNHDHYQHQNTSINYSALFEVQDVLPEAFYNAWLGLIKKHYWEYNHHSHYGLQSTLDQAHRMGELMIPLLVDDSEYEYWKGIVIENSEFNFCYQRMGGHSLDHDGGIDLTYQGRTDHFALQAFSLVNHYDPSLAAHIIPYLENFLEFQRMQCWPEPNRGGYYTGPTGTNAGTSGTDWREQDYCPAKGYRLAQETQSGKFMAFNYTGRGFNAQMASEAQMDATNERFIHVENKYGIDDHHGNRWDGMPERCPVWRHNQNADRRNVAMIYNDDIDYESLASLKRDLSNPNIEAGDDDMIKPMFATGSDFIKSLDQTYLAGKFASGTQTEWGVQVYTNDIGFRGSYRGAGREIAGFLGGMAGFWTKKIGSVLLSLTRGNQGSQADSIDAKRSGMYTGVPSWCTDHLWGRRNGTLFSSAMAARRFDSVTHTIDDDSFTIKASVGMHPLRYEDWNPLPERAAFSEIITNIEGGIQERLHLTGGSVDSLYHTLPIVVTPRRGGITRTVEAYSNGYHAVTGGDSLTGVEYLRCSLNGQAVVMDLHGKHDVKFSRWAHNGGLGEMLLARIAVGSDSIVSIQVDH